MAVREPFYCPVDDMCGCTTGVCERAPKHEEDPPERPWETTLDDLERWDD